MEKEKVLFDTNLLVYLYIKASSKAKAVRSLLEGLAKKKVDIVLAEQCLLEFYSVITDKRRVKKPVSSKTAQNEIKKIYENGPFEIIRPSFKTFGVFLALMENKRIRNGRVFDFYLAATALSNKVKTIFTENEKDFRGIKGLKVINPF